MPSGVPEFYALLHFVRLRGETPTEDPAISAPKIQGGQCYLACNRSVSKPGNLGYYAETIFLGGQVHAQCTGVSIL